MSSPAIIPADDQLVKLLYKDMLHRGYQWVEGCNTHPEPQPFAKGCHTGVFYITEWRTAMQWLRLESRSMYWVADAVPHGETCASQSKIQVHSVTISNLRPLREVFAAMTREQQDALMQQSHEVIRYIHEPHPDQQIAYVCEAARHAEIAGAPMSCTTCEELAAWRTALYDSTPPVNFAEDILDEIALQDEMRDQKSDAQRD